MSGQCSHAPIMERDVRFTLNSDRESEFSQRVMSALPPKADVCGALSHVRFGPKADIRLLFNNLVGAQQNRRMDGNIFHPDECPLSCRLLGDTWTHYAPATIGLPGELL